MPRRKLIPDQTVFAEIRRMLTLGGDKAVSFAAVGAATGLAAPTLVQRFGTREAMVQAALLAGWAELDAHTIHAEAEAPLSMRGAQALLKSLGAEDAGAHDLPLLAADFRDPVLRERAGLWRARVEAALALRLGGGDKGREAAALLFAAWQGQMLWQVAGGKGFRLKDAMRRITP